MRFENRTGKQSLSPEEILQKIVERESAFYAHPNRPLARELLFLWNSYRVRPSGQWWAPPRTYSDAKVGFYKYFLERNELHPSLGPVAGPKEAVLYKTSKASGQWLGASVDAVLTMVAKELAGRVDVLRISVSDGILVAESPCCSGCTMMQSRFGCPLAERHWDRGDKISNVRCAGFQKDEYDRRRKGFLDLEQEGKKPLEEVLLSD